MKRITTLIVTSCFLVSLLGVAQADHGTSRTGTAPGSLRVVDPVSNDWIATAGLTICQNVTNTAPGHCASQALLGGGIFDISDQQSGTKSQSVMYGRLIVEVVTCNPCGSLNISLGNDRDDDGSVTNIDLVDDDLINTTGGDDDHHSTSAFFDDQWANDDLNKSVGPGDKITIYFCFAHDTAGGGADHDWDDLAVFTRTRADNPTIASVKLTLHIDGKSGDNTPTCPNKNYAGTTGVGDTECSDTIDNDGDGKSDNKDPNCHANNDLNDQYQPFDDDEAA